MLTLNAREFSRFAARANEIDRTVIPAMRKGLRKIGQVGVDAVKKAVLENPPNDQPGTYGSREALAAGTRLQVTFGKRGGTVRIVTTNSRLDASHKGFARAYETRGLRHPVYGNEGNTVAQPTRPYFGATIKAVLPDRGQAEMAKVIDAAVRAIGGRGK